MWPLKYSFLCLLIRYTAAVYAVDAPDCQSVAPNQTLLNDVHTSYTSNLPGSPFGLVYAAHAEAAFVSLGPSTRNGTSTLGVLNTTSFPPTLSHEITLNDSRIESVSAFGIALSRDGKYLFVSSGTGAYIVDAHKAVRGANDSVIGLLTSDRNVTGDGAFLVTLTHDGNFAFISQEYGASGDTGNIDVFKLDYSHKDFVSSKHIGFIDLGEAVVGSTLSPDGRLLYVTSEIANHTSTGLAPRGHGIVSVLNVSLLTTTPSQAQISNVTAGCEPVRQIVSSDGRFVWVSSRASNRLLAFNAMAIVQDPANALLASVQVGTSPVGLTFVQNETRIITADSDRFGAPGAYAGLTVVDVQAALAGDGDAVLGYVETGLFPREFATGHDKHTLLVADYSSRQVQAIDLRTLP